jgi:transcriptional regulator with XRE-family HTH domain
MLTLLGMRLAHMREEKGYQTLKAFAERYDLPQVQYWRIENGKANITIKTLVNILKIHNLSLRDFFCGMAKDMAVNH